jgi:hypothetical protein
VCLGPDMPLADGMTALNAYLETVCRMLRRGRPFSQLAVYLPFEDAVIQDRTADGTAFAWELRDAAPPGETAGYHPLWIGEPFLRHAELVHGQTTIGRVSVAALYLDAAWLDAGALEQVVRLARAGASIVLKRRPALPGMRRHPQYAGWLDELACLPNVVSRLDQLTIRPLLAGLDLPLFWAREGAGELLIFVAHPHAHGVHGPLRYGQAFADGPVDRTVTLSYGEASQTVTLRFEPHQSLLIRLTRSGDVSLLDLDYQPPTPHQDS